MQRGKKRLKFIVLTSGTGNLKAERNLEVTTSLTLLREEVM